jgi:hypothetical protein
MCISRTRGGEAITNSKPVEPFDEEEHDSADGTESRIVQYATRAPSALATTSCCTGTSQGVIEVRGGFAPTFAYFLFTARDSVAAGLFMPVLILSTPALDAVTVVATVAVVFNTAVPRGTAAFGGIQVPGATLAFDACMAWGAFPGTVYDGVVLTPFDAIDNFVGIILRPYTFTHFKEGPAPVPFFLFFTATSHASELGSR